MSDHPPHKDVPWQKITRLLLTSRHMDDVEERRLLPEKEILYQFSARGHDLAQLLLGSMLSHKFDAASGYYRSRPLLLSLGLSLTDALAAPMGKSGGFSDGRDIGVVCNLPSLNSPKVLPMAGGVGSQYTPTAGWAQSLMYYRDELKENEYDRAIGVVLGGDGSVATNGFWSALVLATTLELPMLFFIEDNGYGLSVPSWRQTPGGNIASNLASFENLKVLDGDGTDPEEASSLIHDAVAHTREWNGPTLIRLAVPRLCGHSGQDTQAYKTTEEIDEEHQRDPLPKLKNYLVPGQMSEEEWRALDTSSKKDVDDAVEEALARPQPDPSTIRRFVFAENQIQTMGGLAPRGHSFPESTPLSNPEGPRINLATAIRRTLEEELATNPKVLVFGEDVGSKGGVHGATLGLQERFGDGRVFNTSLSEEGIVGRAVGMAYAGLMPATEIQFRKYADPAVEQLNDCGTIRWRTNNAFAAPIVVRVAGGFSKCGDPWHSVSDESNFAHAIGWQVFYPSNAEDAVGLLRTALRSNNPTFFFEHRHLLDATSARRPYPGDSFIVPAGRAATIRPGTELSVITWGAMVERCLAAAERSERDIEVIDLRCLMPWDKESVLQSVEKCSRCLVVHEDTLTAGFGAEVVAVVASEAFLSLKAPVDRLAVPDIPLPYNVGLLQAAIPSIEEITEKIIELLEF